MRLAWVALVGACSFHDGTLGGAPDDGPLPSDTPDVMQQLGAWGSPMEIAELNSGSGDDDPSLTSDLLEIYFGSDRSGGAGYEDIWRATRASPSAPWDSPQPVTELNSASAETTIKVSLDGLAIFFASTRGAGSDFDLYYSTRATRADAWKTPLSIAELSTVDGEYAPWPRNDLLRLIFCHGASVPDEALFISERGTATATWGTPKRINELDATNDSECDPMEPKADTLYFSSNRAGGYYDVYVSHRGSTAWDTPTEVTTINLPSVNDRDPWVSPDERYLVFSSDRSGTDRLYVSTR